MDGLLQSLWAFLCSLFRAVPGVPPAPRSPNMPDDEPSRGEPEWLRLARADLGIEEVKGDGANPAIMRAWRYCAYDPPNGDETAWCSAKMCEWIARAGLPTTNAPNARSWDKWGSKISKPRLGSVVVSWRGSRTGWQGHVALYIGPGDTPGKIKVLGGNQSDSVSIAECSTKQVISYRWPTTGGTSRTLKAQQIGFVGDSLTVASLSGKGIIEALPDALALSTSVQSLATYWPWFAVVGIAIGILARAATIYARISDWETKGT